MKYLLLLILPLVVKDIVEDIVDRISIISVSDEDIEFYQRVERSELYSSESGYSNYSTLDIFTVIVVGLAMLNIIYYLFVNMYVGDTLFSLMTLLLIIKEVRRMVEKHKFTYGLIDKIKIDSSDWFWLGLKLLHTGYVAYFLMSTWYLS